MQRLLAPLAILLVLSGCNGAGGGGKPVRTSDAIEVEPAPSLITVPVEADLADLSRVLEREIPQQL
ncbi:MAG: hypothetical protein VW935_03870, partial [Novosphingobium sp.]